MKVTLKQLCELNACTGQRILFKRYFGEGGTVTKARCLKVADHVDWNWACIHLLSGTARGWCILEFDQLRRNFHMRQLHYHYNSPALEGLRLEYRKQLAITFWEASKMEDTQHGRKKT